MRLELFGGKRVEFFAGEKEKARCVTQRDHILRQESSKGVFVPQCREDGSYAEVQCHRSTGYCWCVDEDGKPVRGSSIQNERPKCDQKGTLLCRTPSKTEFPQSSGTHTLPF
ncbi:SPARC-related modular calcium-binding protein 1 [Caerostris extrusa]|uniref:SPARC-related modular calcium-binding protein 1 n=1 Tax=Caerostris extrusa TaxID=172846 RepID=A0AAV4R922_CAEEX|nr:SPARC-related modular calcium-binding protein 1 [Caerostris extrusa]